MAAQNYVYLGKVKFYTYDLLDMLIYVEPKRCYEFLFGVNRELRSFLEHNYPKFNRGYENEG